MTFSLSFSLIIPSRNESHDIAETLDCCLAITYPHKEIIVVDDSSDETPDIVRSYADRGVQLIHRVHNHNGCCGARNVGMQVATGDIIVIINADVRPGADFLDKLIAHYEQGADLVVCRSYVRNNNELFGRYIYARGMVGREKGREPYWSEGFSCRRSAAEAVGYIPGDFPVPFCRDNLLGKNLMSANFTKHLDMDIYVEHDSPKTLREFWGNQVWRATFAASYLYHFENKSLFYITVRELAKSARMLALTLIIVPILYRSWRMVKYTEGWRTFFALVYVAYVADMARLRGTFKGLSRLRAAVQVAQSQEMSLPRYQNG